MPYEYKKIRQARTLDVRPKLVANALRLGCRRRRLATVALARKAGVPLLSVQLALKGQSRNASFWTMARLAQALQLDLNYLAGLAPAQKGRPHGHYTVLL
jgi:DNA-binding phage protein